MVDVEVYNRGIWERISNIDKGKFHKKLNGLGKFNFVVEEVRDDQRDFLVEGAEVRFIDGDLTYGGVVTKVDGEENVRVEGADYLNTVSKKLLKLDDVEEADDSLSSKYKVVYNDVPFQDIVIDIAEAGGLSADSDSVDSFENLLIEFKYFYIKDALEELRRQSGYEMFVDDDKKLYMKERVGSDSVVGNLVSGGNFKVISKEENYQRRVTRAVVFGSGNAEGEYEDSEKIDNGEIFEKRFKFDSLTSDSACEKRAEEIVKDYKDPIYIIEGQTYVRGYSLGDMLNVTTRSGEEELRVTSIELDVSGRRRLELTSKDRKHRREDVEEVQKELLYQSRSIGGEVSTGDFLDDLTFSEKDVIGSESEMVHNIYIDPENITNVNSSKIVIKRIEGSSVIGENTGEAYSGGGINNDSENADVDINNDNENAGHEISNQKTGSPDDGYSSSEYDQTVDSTFLSEWWDGLSSWSLSNTDYMMHYIAGEVTVNFNDNSGGSLMVCSVRANRDSGSERFPSYDGLSLGAHYAYSGSSGSVTFPFILFIPYNWNGSDYRLETYVSETGSRIKDYDVTFRYVGQEGHEHSNSLLGGYHEHSNSLSGGYHEHNNSFSDSRHSNSININPRIIDTEGDRELDLYVDGDKVDNFTLNEIGDSKEIDLSNYIDGVGGHEVVIESDGVIAISSNVSVTVFKEGEEE